MIDFTPLLRFNIGDKSASDVRYEEHLKRQKALLKALEDGPPK